MLVSPYAGVNMRAEREAGEVGNTSDGHLR